LSGGLGIIAGILVARHLKSTEDMFDSRSEPAYGVTDVGARLSRDQLVQVVQGMKAGNAGSAMPPLPDMTEQQMNDLVDFEKVTLFVL
jgi:hypothetical protein